MLLATAREWPDREGGALEPKWDGYRMVAAVIDGRVRCWSRHGTDLTGRVGGVLGELRELLPDGTLVDGELVALGSAPAVRSDSTLCASARGCLAATIMR